MREIDRQFCCKPRLAQVASKTADAAHKKNRCRTGFWGSLSVATGVSSMTETIVGCGSNLITSPVGKLSRGTKQEILQQVDSAKSPGDLCYRLQWKLGQDAGMKKAIVSELLVQAASDEIPNNL